MGHLWRRPSGFVFQIHIPHRRVDALGRSPFRISLGHLSTDEARRRARILAGRAAILLEVCMEREVVSKSLEALANQMAALGREEFSARFKALPRFSEENDPDLHLLDDVRRKIHETQAGAIQGARQRFEEVAAALAQDTADFEAERSAYDRIVERLAKSPAPALNLNEAVGISATALPSLSATLEDYLARKREDDVGEDHVGGLTRRFQAFIGHSGDKLFDQYKASSLQSFAFTLARVPDVWSIRVNQRGSHPHPGLHWL